MYYKIKNEICSAFLKWIIKVQKVNFWRGNLCKYFFFRIILCKCFLVSLTKIYIAFLDNMSRPNSQLARYCLLWSHMLHSFILLDVTQPHRKMSLSLFRVQGILGAKKITPYLGNLTNYHCISCEEEQKRPLKPSYKNRTESWPSWRIGSLVHWLNCKFIN